MLPDPLTYVLFLVLTRVWFRRVGNRLLVPGTYQDKVQARWGHTLGSWSQEPLVYPIRRSCRTREGLSPRGRCWTLWAALCASGRPAKDKKWICIVHSTVATIESLGLLKDFSVINLQCEISTKDMLCNKKFPHKPPRLGASTSPEFYASTHSDAPVCLGN